MSHLDALYRHMAWADATVWRAVLATPAAEGDENLKTLIHHLHMVQRAFYDVWRGEPQRPPELGHFPDLASLAGWAREYHTLVAAYRATVADEELDSRIVTLPWAKWIEQSIGRPPDPTTLGETMVQVTSHSTYHRGQVNVRLRGLGGEPPLVDFIAWIWMGKPQPEWPVV